MFESVKACGLCACGSSSVCEREIVGEGSSNSCVGISAELCRSCFHPQKQIARSEIQKVVNGFGVSGFRVWSSKRPAVGTASSMFFIHILTYMYVYMYTCACMCIYIGVSICMYVYIYVHIYTYTCTYIYV